LKAFVSALFAVCCLLVLPGVASAATYIVNSTGDAPDNGAPNGVCETATPGECTLRAAITEANSSTGVADEIDFAGLFSGEDGDTISAATALPTITDELEIHGGACNTAAGTPGPCAEVTRAGDGFLLVVEDDDVEIQGLALNGATTAINVINASEGFVAKGNWIGFGLTGATPGNDAGIFIDPGSDGAAIGGTAPAERNVIGGSAGVGLDIEGASNATIEGNYFGVTPKGDTGAANAQSIEITDSTADGGFQAENNEIGAAIEGAALDSNACDGGCNVISGAGSRGLDLNGAGPDPNEAPASGPTTVHGNFFGLNAAGTAALGSGLASLFAGGADHVTVGAATFSSPIPPEANYFAGEAQGIDSRSGGNDFEARGNSIGLAPDGTAVAAPIGGGISVVAQSVSEGATIESNQIRMPGGIAIEHKFGEGRILENEIEGGAVGIRQWAAPGGGLIAGNVVEDSIGSGIILESPDTDVRGNSVFDSAGAGINVRNRPGVATNGSRIGNDTAEGENLIEGSGGPAIEILEEATEPGSTTEVARNRGSDNGGLFIDLVAGANEGVAPPTFTSAVKSHAEGTAEPGALVRVFRKGSAEAGELASFLGEAVADGSGKWKVTYAPVPGKTIIAATQTSEDGGTSELATANVPADPPTCVDTPSMCLKPDPPVNPPLCPAVPGCDPQPTNPPVATITKGPKAKSASTTATFKFKSSVAGSTFECKLDDKPFKKCRSPKKYKNLKPGEHVFKVRAKNQAGNIGKVAKRRFTVLDSHIDFPSSGGFWG
jgi:CSLREA domain-containing protein